jgi:tetratricopeptide (TPR) repeat protein
MFFWVDLPPEMHVDIRADGWLLKSEIVAVQEGQRLHVEVPPRAWVIQVTTPRGGTAWSLALAPYPELPLESRALYLWRAGKPEEARRLLAPFGIGPPRAERWQALHLLTHIAYQVGDEREAEELCKKAIVAQHDAGSRLTEATDATFLARLQIQQSQLDAARKVLAGLQLPAGSPAKAVYLESYYRGLLAVKVGDARSALVDLQGAADQAERAGLEEERWDAEQELGLQLQALGRSSDAAALFDRLRRTQPPNLPACNQAERLINQAWSLLLAREAGETLGDPIPLLEEAQRTCPSHGVGRLNYFLNLSLAHLQAGRPDPARAALIAARALDRFTTPFYRLWSLELEARLDLADGRPEAALQLYDLLDELAANASSPESRWRAAYGRARCYQALKRPAEALAALGKAESLLDEQSLQIPIQEGRETFAAQREGATGLYLELLLAGGRNAEALEMARRARSRVLRQLARGDRLAHLTSAEQERWDKALAAYWLQRTALDANAADDWRLPADRKARVRAARAAQYKEVERILDRAFTVFGRAGEREPLPPPRAGEVILAYYPLAHGWVGFAATGGEIAIHRFELPDGRLAPTADLSARLLAPFRAQILRAERVRVLLSGRLSEVDFHALPFESDILLAARPVVYGLDLAVPVASQPPAWKALVVANPLEDLPAALLEADAVTAALHSQKPAWSVEDLRGEKASAGTVRGALRGVDLLHYAGHGVFSGFSGWESVLPLAGSTSLTLGDLLALGRPPRWVVLSGCETGRSSAGVSVEGLGLAHAFLLAGSRAVIAATRPVGDRAAEGLFAELYRHWGPEPDLAVLLQQAQLAWRRREPAAADWVSFRLFAP